MSNDERPLVDESIAILDIFIGVRVLANITPDSNAGEFIDIEN